MQKLWQWIQAHHEGISYLIFGAMGTLLSFVLLNLFTALFGMAFATGAGNVLNNAICILFAYWTNRTFVFHSRNHGAAARTEFLQFVGARIGTSVLDQVVMWLGVGVLGARLSAAGGIPTGTAGGPDGPTVVLSTLSPALWANLVKLFSMVLVIVCNYVFSKLIVFKNR